jgi:hypothetical protein
MTMKRKLVVAAALAAFWTLPAGASELPIYEYGGTPNYCPAGLKPVVFDGVISCGVPNRSITYQQATRAPVYRAKRHPVRRVAKPYCPEGLKGCAGE